MNRLNKMIQNYRVLTNNKYRLVTNIVIPVVLGIITAVLAEGLFRDRMHMQKEWLWNGFFKNKS